MTLIRSMWEIPVFLLRIFLFAIMLAYPLVPALADQSQTFVWVADTRGDDNDHLVKTSILTPIVNSILAMEPAPNVVIFGGDMAYRGGTPHLQVFMDVFTNRLDAAGIPSAYTVGNHELYTMHASPLDREALTRQKEFQALFNNSWTQNGPSGLDNLAFSFHLGNSLFIIADSYLATADGTSPVYGVNEAQQTWMKGLLENNNAAHTFVLTHVPAYSPTVPSANNAMKNTWQTITTSGNATNTNASILFAGHEHLYYRTLHDGTYEVLAGSAGAGLSCKTTCGPVYPGDVYAFRYNYAIVTIDGRYITVSVLDEHNHSIDFFKFFDNSGLSNRTIINSTLLAPDPLEKRPTGILAASNNIITNNAPMSSVFTGIDAVSNNAISNTSIIAPLAGGNGIHVYDGNTIINTASGVITGNSTGLWGIRAGSGNTVLNEGAVTVTGTNSIGFLARGDDNILHNTGTLSASGTNSYAAKFLGTGNRFVNAGTLSGNLWFDAGDNAFVNSGTFGGTGALYKYGSGTLTLRGDATHTGGTHLHGGTVNINDDASLGAPAAAVYFDGGVLQLDADVTSARNATLDAGGGTVDTNSFTGTWSGAISGTGSLTKTGAGALTLQGASTYTGGTTVNGGLLLVNNTAGSGTGTGLVTVTNGGTLGGAGSMGGSVFTAGVVSPGNSVGTMTIGGHYTQNSTGILRIEVESPAANDLLQVGGNAVLDGTLNIVWNGSAIPANKTVFGTILTAGSVSGRFANLTGGISPTLYLKPQYDRAGQVYLLAERDYAASELLSSLTANQRAVAAMLSPLANSASGDLETVLSRIDNLTTNTEVAAALSQLAPITGGAQTGMTSWAASFQSGNAASRLSDLRLGFGGFSFQGTDSAGFPVPQSVQQPFLVASNSDDLRGMIPEPYDPRWGVFVKGNLAVGEQKDSPEQRGYDFKNGGVTLGADYRLSKAFAAGVLFGMNTAKSWINDAGSTVKMEGYTVGLYGTYSLEQFFMDGQASYGRNEFDNSRRIFFPGVNRTATASFHGDQATVYAGVGYDWRSGPWTFSPAVNFQYLSMWMNGYTESGADSLNLQVDRQRSESFQGSAGIRTSWNGSGETLKVVPSFWVFYRHEFGNVDPATIASLAQGSSAFTIQSAAPERNFLNVGAGVNIHWTDRILTHLSYEAQIGESRYISQSVALTLRMQF